MDESKKIITLPYSNESEMMVLGCMLSNEHSFLLAAAELDDSHFYQNEHKIIFQSLKEARRKNKPADIHLICEGLKNQDKLQIVGGAAYITTLAQYAGTSAYIEEYIDVLKGYLNKRRLTDLGLDLQKRALSEDDPEKIIISIQEKLQLIEKNRPIKDRFSIKFLDQFESNFLLCSPPKKPMLLEYARENGNPTGFLPKGIVAMLVGAGGLGKTHLLTQLAISVATGTPWLGRFTTTEHCGLEKKGNVFIGLGENQYEDIHRVLYKASKKLRLKQPDILDTDPLKEASKRIAAFSFCGQQAAFIEDKKPSLYFRRFKMKLIEIAPKDGWSLIILDPISRLSGGDVEKDNGEATQLIALLEELSIELPGNPTILFAHHVSKASIRNGGNQDQTAARGSSALTDGVRWQINLSKDKVEDKEIMKLKMTKSNFTETVPEMNLEKDTEGFISAETSKEIPMKKKIS